MRQLIRKSFTRLFAGFFISGALISLVIVSSGKYFINFIIDNQYVVMMT